jgi:hypothetical protein
VQRHGANLSLIDGNGKTPLDVATEAGQTAVAQMLSGAVFSGSDERE